MRRKNTLLLLLGLLAVLGGAYVLYGRLSSAVETEPIMQEAQEIGRASCRERV